MQPEELTSKRSSIGILAILLIVGYLILTVTAPENYGFQGVCLRVGTMLGAFWLAIPTLASRPKLLKRLPWYLVLGIILFAAFIKYLFVLLPLFLLLFFLSLFAGKKPPDQVG